MIPHTEEHKEKIRQSCLSSNCGKWMKDRKMSDAARQKISAFNTGRHHSDKTRAKISAALKGRSAPWAGANGFHPGNKPWNDGGTFTDATKDKLSVSLKKYYDRMGRADIKRCHHLNDREYAKWRKSIFERDKFTCQDCGQVGGILNAHHKRGWAKFPALRYDIDNGVTLCGKCHRRAYKKHGNDM